LSFASPQSSSSTVWPVAVNLAVAGHLTNIRLIMGAFVSVAALKKF